MHQLLMMDSKGWGPKRSEVEGGSCFPEAEFVWSSTGHATTALRTVTTGAGDTQTGCAFNRGESLRYHFEERIKVMGPSKE
ncbi:hypothetical protein NDU88_003914 [Pleurodeles waltl]|uniref:Uncharacterized protein n=1 Tax=Pleurodeles waltl TaxID=8319 RepID=A0AAV7RHL7_PLEWA|nr:hypothetical protein NDU88_003914 [Pleurodeles waltl]